MAHSSLSTRSLPRKRHCGGEDTLAALAGLDCAGSKGLALTHVLDVVDDGDCGIAGENEVAVHAVHAEVGGNSALSGGETLCDDGSSVHTSCSGWMPEGAGIGIQVLQHGQL